MGAYLDLWDVSDGHPKAREELEALTRIESAMEKLATMMEMNWGRHEEAGYCFPTRHSTVLSHREECRVDDLVAWVEEQDIETDLND